MEYKLAITDFFNAIENDDEREAKQLCEAVQHELEVLNTMSGLNASARVFIKGIAELKGNVSSGKMNLARRKWRTLKAGFNGFLKTALQNAERRRSEQTFEVLSGGERKKPAIQGDEVSGKSPPLSTAQQKSTRNTFDNGAKITPAETPEVLSVGGRKKAAAQIDEVHGKRVSQARRQDDVADLSDVNRPTKIAERFSELFDNEWVDVFESLSKNKGDEQLKESEIISILLEIVEQAYHFCYVEAEDQITNIEVAVAGILKGDARPVLQSARSNQNQRRRHLLLQYRKEMAADATERLSKEFFQRYIFRIFENNSLAIPSNGGPTATYSRKAVELTWLMCVEDPPIFMCPTRGKFNPSLYRPYTKTGTEADIFVWPALKLNKDGAVLLKGVVQYK
ncbi:uncharacterized protein LOC128557020 [Mercenaria mercenaria]|uniref:uncharacterized protein LOC128557020 n=1 Tax=Mercenaria mercenaria TaxID=6596 RepID=UPI00234EA069|nr:uncharacterized protein LOC128557020 [Mercenaria mercenaria]